MKRFFSVFALMLIMSLVLLPFGAAFATDGDGGLVSEPADEGDGVMTILSSEDEAAETDENSAITYAVYDGSGKETRNFSQGLGCGLTGYTFYTDHDYKISFVYVNSKTSEKIKDAVVTIVDCDKSMQDKYLTVEGNSVIIKAGKENYSFKIAIVEDGTVTSSQLPINVAKFKVEFTDIILMGIGVYALVTAITGSGAMFRNEFIKEGREDDFKKYVRICAAVVGVCMLAAAAISIFACSIDSMFLKVLRYVLFGIGIAALIGSLVITSRMTDKEKKAKAMTGGRAGASNSSAAFEFDENEPTIDDVIANMKNKNEN